MPSVAMIRGLRALDAAEDKTLPLGAFRKALKVTPRGFYTVQDRMVDQHLITQVDCGTISLTFKGMQALKGDA